MTQLLSEGFKFPEYCRSLKLLFNLTEISFDFLRFSEEGRRWKSKRLRVLLFTFFELFIQGIHSKKSFIFILKMRVNERSHFPYQVSLLFSKFCFWHNGNRKRDKKKFPGVLIRQQKRHEIINLINYRVNCISSILRNKYTKWFLFVLNIIFIAPKIISGFHFHKKFVKNCEKTPDKEKSQTRFTATIRIAYTLAPLILFFVGEHETLQRNRTDNDAILFLFYFFFFSFLYKKKAQRNPFKITFFFSVNFFLFPSQRKISKANFYHKNFSFRIKQNFFFCFFFNLKKKRKCFFFWKEKVRGREMEGEKEKKKKIFRSLFSLSGAFLTNVSFLAFPLFLVQSIHSLYATTFQRRKTEREWVGERGRERKREKWIFQFSHFRTKKHCNCAIDQIQTSKF